MFSSHSRTKLSFESSFRNFLNLRGHRVTKRRVYDDLNIFDRPDDIRKREEWRLADGRSGESVARHDDVIRIFWREIEKKLTSMLFKAE